MRWNSSAPAMASVRSARSRDASSMAIPFWNTRSAAPSRCDTTLIIASRATLIASEISASLTGSTTLVCVGPRTLHSYPPVADGLIVSPSSRRVMFDAAVSGRPITATLSGAACAAPTEYVISSCMTKLPSLCALTVSAQRPSRFGVTSNRALPFDGPRRGSLSGRESWEISKSLLVTCTVSVMSCSFSSNNSGAATSGPLPAPAGSTPSNPPSSCTGGFARLPRYTGACSGAAAPSGISTGDSRVTCVLLLSPDSAAASGACARVEAEAAQAAVPPQQAQAVSPVPVHGTPSAFAGPARAHSREVPGEQVPHAKDSVAERTAALQPVGRLHAAR